MMLQKRYVAVDSHTTVDGAEAPTAVYWPDGRKFPIQRVIEKTDREHAKVGGTGMSFLCQFEGGGTTKVFHEEKKWFVEAKVTASDS